MSEWDPYLIALGLIVAWCVGAYLLQKRGILAKHNIIPYAGPILMWKTERGKAFLDWLARPKRFWRVFGDVSLVLVTLAMAGTTALLAWEATLVQNAAVRANPPSPALYLGLPGINPIIPIGYGIFALAVSIVLHEFAHGILSRTSNVKINSLGGVFFVVPIGAFVEPNEDEMRAMPRRERMRLYAAGPATNIVLAILFGVLFSTMMMYAVQPVHTGVAIGAFTAPTSAVQSAGMKQYEIITTINGTATPTYPAFVEAMSHVHPNQTIVVQGFYDSTYTNYTVTLGVDPSTGRPLLGIYPLVIDPTIYHPLTDPGAFGGVENALFTYISLPFSGHAPIQDQEASFYTITGPWAVLPAPLFWVLVNSLYWLFWINFALGTFNALPMVPLDGGFLFSDGVKGFLGRVKSHLTPEARDQLANRVSYIAALAILFLVLWQFIGPRI